MNLGGFIDTFKDAIARRVVESYPPLYRPSENGGTLPRLLRKPPGSAGRRHQGRGPLPQGPPGAPPSSARWARARPSSARPPHTWRASRRILVICPPHLVPKWKREVEEMTVPGVRAAIVESITDLERLRLSVGSGPLFAVMSREKAKLSYRWMPAVTQRWAVSKGRFLRNEETAEPFRIPCCPDCTAQVVDKDGVPLTDADLNRRKHVCADCGAPLWQADPVRGQRRYPLADYIKHRMKGFFDLLIGDEVHEFKGRGSAQGIAAGILADVCGKSLSLTGTLLCGYSSTIFHLLYRFSPEIRTEFGRSDEHRWIQRYGFEEITVGKPDDDAVEDGRNSRRRKYSEGGQGEAGTRSQRPLPHHRQHGVPQTGGRCLRPAGLRGEDPRVLDGLGGGLDGLTPSARPTTPCSRSCARSWRPRSRAAPSGCWPPTCKRCSPTRMAAPGGETVFDPRTGDVIVQVPPLSEEKLYPKEKALIDLVAAERLEGRAGYWSTSPIPGPGTSRGGWTTSSPGTGFRVAVLKADAVAPERREAWGGGQGEGGHRRPHLPPRRLVQTGLDLIDFPTIVWDETDYSVYVVRQASRRSWRIGQTRPVKVVFMSLPEHAPGGRAEAGGEEDAELPGRGGRAAGGRPCRLRGRGRRHDDGPGPQDRQRRGGRTRPRRWRRCSPQARNAESEAEELLVDDGWKAVEVEPETVEVNGNGDHDAIGIGADG